MNTKPELFVDIVYRVYIYLALVHELSSQSHQFTIQNITA